MCVHVHVSLCMCVSMYVCVSVCQCVSVFVHMSLCMCVRVHVCVSGLDSLSLLSTTLIPTVQVRDSLTCMWNVAHMWCGCILYCGSS